MRSQAVLKCKLCSNMMSGENQDYCCAGCQFVYEVLNAKEVRGNFTEHPLYKQAVNSGLISNPKPLEEKAEISSREIKKIFLEITGMWCPSCAKIIQLIVLKIKGVSKCCIDYTTDLGTIEFSLKSCSEQIIFDAIQKIGYGIKNLKEDISKPSKNTLFLRFVISAFCSVNLMMFAYPLYAAFFNRAEPQLTSIFLWSSLAFSIPLLTYSGTPIFRKGILAIKHGILNMEILILIGVSTAFIQSFWNIINGRSDIYLDSMGIIITFVLLGKLIESKSKLSTKETLFRLHRSMPKRARKRFLSGIQQFVPLKEVAIEDEIVVLTGEKIVVDGVVLEREGVCNESVMTGESALVQKTEGDSVLTGTLLENGYLVVKVTTKIEHSSLHQIIEMIEKDLEFKAGHIPITDKIVQGFIPFVIAAAFFTGMYFYNLGNIEEAITRSIAILIISCPCAIGIAAPLAESYLIQHLSLNGAMIKNRHILSQLGKETVFVFDKTGTVTEGKFQVLEGIEKLSFQDQKILFSLTARSSHPISHAIHKECWEKNLFYLENFQEIAGKGIKGVFEDSTYLLGSKKFFEEQGVMDLPYIETEDTVVFFGKNCSCISALILGDALRKDAKEAIASLKPLKTILLSGDGLDAVEKIAKLCGTAQWHAEASPLKKREIIESLRQKGEIVAMIGDGINDAPALAQANIGIAVYSASDMSSQVADLLFTTNDLNRISKIRGLAIKGRKILKQNLFWAFFYNGIGIPLAIFGMMTPVFAAFVMTLSSLFVLFNAKRIK